MKNIIKSLLLGVVAAVPVFLTSCESDTDSNPTAIQPDSFVLNPPANAENNVYDLAQSNYVELTTSQPNYGGMPLATKYAVEVSIDPAFAQVQPSEAYPAIDYMTLTDIYTSATLHVNAKQLNNAVVDLYFNKYQDYPSDILPIYIRLRAWVPGGTSSTVEHGVVYSNVITLPKVKASYVAPELTLPTELYVCGSHIGNAWSTWKALAPVYGMEGEFYTLIYSDGTAQFKWGEYPQQWLSYANVKTVNDNAGANIEDADGDNHNIKINTPGWYVLYVTAKINGAVIDYTFNFEKGAAGVIGNAFDTSWSGKPFAVPADNGEWVSEPAEAAGELRAYITVPGRDWWRTEFTLNEGQAFWRTMDIPNNWKEDVGPDYSVQVSAGQKLYMNFDTNTGYVK